MLAQLRIFCNATFRTKGVYQSVPNFNTWKAQVYGDARSNLVNLRSHVRILHRKPRNKNVAKSYFAVILWKMDMNLITM